MFDLWNVDIIVETINMCNPGLWYFSTDIWKKTYTKVNIFSNNQIKFKNLL